MLNLAIVAAPLLWHWRRQWRPALALVVSTLAVLGLVVAYNSAAAGHLTGLSENGGLTFYQGHCDVHQVTARLGTPDSLYSLVNPVAIQRHRGHDQVFLNRSVWDQGFFFEQGLRCARKDGLGHLARLGRNLLDTTALTVPWPMSAEDTVGDVARMVNLCYSLLLPVIVGGALLLLRRRRGALTAGPGPAPPARLRRAGGTGLLGRAALSGAL